MILDINLSYKKLARPLSYLRGKVMTVEFVSKNYKVSLSDKEKPM